MRKAQVCRNCDEVTAREVSESHEETHRFFCENCQTWTMAILTSDKFLVTVGEYVKIGNEIGRVDLLAPRGKAKVYGENNFRKWALASELETVRIP